MAQGIVPTSHVPAQYAALIDAIGAAAMEVARLIARNGIDSHLGASAGENSDGDIQKALDLIADDLFAAAARRGGVRHYASEEQAGVVSLDPRGSLALAIDPLDGSSNIDTNLSVGTIFALYPAAAEAEASFLRPVAEQAGAGYIIYGPQTAMLLSFGAGLQRYVLDPAAGRFVLVDAAVTIPEDSSEFAINASNYRHWPKPVRTWVDDAVAGVDGPRGKNFNMRWLASLVAEAHRIIGRGGIFLYPRDDRPGYEAGRLRLLYECGPIALLVTQAGGGATDGTDPILRQTVTALHQRTPFVFGTLGKVARVAAYHDLPEAEGALFGKRGLFRS